MYFTLKVAARCSVPQGSRKKRYFFSHKVLTSPPLELYRASKNVFFLNGRALTFPLLVAGPLKKDRFLRIPLLKTTPWHYIECDAQRKIGNLIARHLLRSTIVRNLNYYLYQLPSNKTTMLGSSCRLRTKPDLDLDPQPCHFYFCSWRIQAIWKVCGTGLVAQGPQLPISTVQLPIYPFTPTLSSIFYHTGSRKKNNGLLQWPGH